MTTATPKVEFMPDKPGWAHCLNCGAEWEVEPIRRCYWCGEEYSIGTGSHSGLTFYPEAESRFWQHTARSERHRTVLTVLAHQQRQILEALPDALRNAKQAQKDRENPTYQSLTELLS